MSRLSDLHERWSRDSDYRAAYDELGPEFELARREWRKRLAQRPQADLGIEAAALLAEEHSLRDVETG